MTAQQLIRVLRERWILLLLGLIVGAIVALGVSLATPPTYAAGVTLYISSQAPADNATAAYQGNLLSTQRTASYVELLTSERIARDVLANLQLPLTPEQLRAKLSAESTQSTVVISLSATDRDPALAATIANAAADSFVRLVAQLEQPPERNRLPVVAARIVQTAEVPLESVSPVYSLNIPVGAGIGLIVALGYVLLRRRLDTAIRSVDEVEQTVGVSNIGEIPDSERLRDHPLLTAASGQSVESEAFRQLRTNVQFIDLDEARKVVVVTSSVPAEGKSVVVSNLAATLANLGFRVVAVEGDLRKPRLSEYFGLEQTVGLTSVLTGRLNVKDAIQAGPVSGLDVLASGPLPPNPSEVIASRQMESLLSVLRESYDFVLIDSPPLLPVTDAAELAARVDGAIIVARYGHTTDSQLRGSVRALEAVSAKLLGSILTMIPTNASGTYGSYRSYYGSGQGHRPHTGTGDRAVGGAADEASTTRPSRLGSTGARGRP